MKYYSSTDKKDTNLYDANGNLSIFSNLLEKVFDLNSDSNLAITLSSDMVDLLPILAYSYMSECDKNFMIISNKKHLNTHLINYQYLTEDGSYIFNFKPSIYTSNDGNTIKILNKRIKKKHIEDEIHTLKNMLKLGADFNFLFFSDFENINSLLNSSIKTNIDNDSEEFMIKENMGMIFIENVDVLLSNPNIKKSFLSLVEKLNSKGIKVSTLITNPYSKDLSLGENENFKSLLLNDFLIREYLYNSGDSIITSNKYELIKHNISSLSIENLQPVSIPGLNDLEDSILMNLKELRNISNLPKDFKFIFYILNLLRTLSIHPSFARFTMLDENDCLTCGDFNKFENLMKLKFSKLEGNDDNYYLYDETLRNIFEYHIKLSNTNRFGEDTGFSVNSKNHVLMTYLKKLDLNSDSEIKTVGVVFYSRLESVLLREQIERLELVNIKVKTINYKYVKYITEDFDKVIFPGIYGSKDNFIQAVNKFSSVEILSYLGNESEMLTKIIKFDKNSYVIDSFNSIKSFSCPKLDSIINKIGENINLVEGVKTSVDDINFLDLLTTLETKTKTEYDIKYFDGIPSNKNSVTLTKFETNEVKNISVGEFTKFNKILNDGQVENVLLKDLNIGDLIYIFDGGLESIFKLVEGLSETSDFIDFDEIDEWKNNFTTYLEDLTFDITSKNGKDSISTKELWELYEIKCKQNKLISRGYQTFKGWINEEVIGPQKKEDLVMLGKLVGFEDIENNVDYLYSQISKIRALHIKVGRYVRNILPRILTNSLEKELNIYEETIFESIRVYRVSKIN